MMNNSLAIVEEHFSRWARWLSAGENSVFNQLHDLVYNDAFFRILNEARRLGSKAGGNASNNGALAAFIDEGYVAKQVIGIWKLCDPATNVISLKRIVNELIKINRQLTRFNYVTRFGHEYSSADAEVRHRFFDRLAAVKPEARDKKDRMAQSVITELTAALQGADFEAMRLLRHLRLAHAADENSISTHAHVPVGVTLGQVRECHRRLFCVYQFIDHYVIDNAMHIGAIATPQYAIFKGLDREIVRKDDLDELWSYWYKNEKEAGEWLEYHVLADLMPSLAANN